MDKITLDLRNGSNISKELLLFTMCHFICEARKETEEYFPPKTLRDIVSMVQIHLKKFGYKWKLLEDDYFFKLQMFVNNEMKDKAAMGLGCSVKSADPLQVVDTERLWSEGFLGNSTPKLLSQTVHEARKSILQRADAANFCILITHLQNIF